LPVFEDAKIKKMRAGGRWNFISGNKWSEKTW